MREGEPRVHRLWIEQSTICFGAPERVVVRIPIAELRLIAESTNESGPASDDWFLILATSSEHWTEISMYTAGIHEFFAEVARILGAPSLETSLAGSTSFASNILWPPDLTGRPAFLFESFPRWQQWLTLGIRGNRQRYSLDALDALARSRVRLTEFAP
ncbi:MAG: hypothetical protein EPO68_08710 [Planctomycetota bacterium]|nr:MAG: hypothetical protein EPO68_08710 [Planctomycetota bacterium]